MSADQIMSINICQKVFDFFTIFADLLVRQPIEDKILLPLICFMSIAFVAILLGAFGMFLLDISHESKNLILNIFEFVAGATIFGGAILGLILSLLLLAKAKELNILATASVMQSMHTKLATSIQIESIQRDLAALSEEL